MFRLPFLFIITGIVSFILFQILTIADLATWIHDQPRNPIGWFRIHLFVLGWATMIAMGAVYQLLNVVLQSEIYSEKIGFVHYAFFLFGTSGLLIGFQTAQIKWIAGFASITFMGIILFAWNLIMTMYRAKQWNTITISCLCAILYLVMTAITGMIMGLNFYFNKWGDFHEQLFGAHIWFGSLGWFGMLITGFSYKMLPMFYLSHGHPVRLQQTVVVIWNAAVMVGAISFLLNGPNWIRGCSIILLLGAVIAYNIHLSQIIIKRHKANPGAGIQWAVGSARALILTCTLAFIACQVFPQSIDLNLTYVLAGWTYLWGFVAITILAYCSKIVPFLWWTQKYGSQIGKQKVPMMSDLMNDRTIHLGLALIVGSLVVLIVGLGLNQTWLLPLSGVALSVSSLFYMGLIVRVFTK